MTLGGYSKGMRDLLRLLPLGVLAVFLGGAGCASMSDSAAAPHQAAHIDFDRKALALRVADSWDMLSALAARRLIEQYGAPDEVRSSRMLWIRSGPWKRTVVSDVAGDYLGPKRQCVVEQTIDYPFAPDQAARVAAFNDDLVSEADTGELSARSEREELNFLKINLAVEVASRQRTVEEAQAFYRKVLELEAAGKSYRYTAGLLFPYAP